MRSNSSGCLTAIVASFSRIVLLCAWIARPAMMNAAFSTFIIPCLGFMFLPFTTLMYVILVQGVGIRAWTGCGWASLRCWTSPASPGRGRQSQSHPRRRSWLVRREGASGSIACPAECGDTAHPSRAAAQLSRAGRAEEPKDVG